MIFENNHFEIEESVAYNVTLSGFSQMLIDIFYNNFIPSEGMKLL